MIENNKLQTQKFMSPFFNENKRFEDTKPKSNFSLAMPEEYQFPIKDQFKVSYLNSPGRFGASRKTHTHAGSDIYAEVGTPVFPIKEGVVMENPMVFIPNIVRNGQINPLYLYEEIAHSFIPINGAPKISIDERVKSIWINHYNFIGRYCEITPVSDLKAGTIVSKYEPIATVANLNYKLEEIGKKTNIWVVKTYSLQSMLHFEMYSIDALFIASHEQRKAYLLDPTEFLEKIRTKSFNFFI